MHLPKVDFSTVDLSAPGTGTWPAVRAKVTAALTTTGCFVAHYPALTVAHRAALFDGAVRPLFALPEDAKRRNHHDKPFHGYLGGGGSGYESLAVVDAPRPEQVQAFADLLWPDGGRPDGFCEAVHGAAKSVCDLEAAVRRMVMEGLLGVADEHHEALNPSSSWHLFRMSEYRAAANKEKALGYAAHQDTNMLSVVCQHDVDGLELQTRDGHWVLAQPAPTEVVVMAGNALRVLSNDRVHAPFHRVTVSGGDVTRYSTILFSVPEFRVQVLDELVDEQHPPRFKPHDHQDFVRFCASEEGARHQDKLKAFCGV